jgi:ribosome-associated protein YbcJ (S4-like RNA binding protein)
VEPLRNSNEIINLGTFLEHCGAVKNSNEIINLGTFLEHCGAVKKQQ